MSHEDRAMRLRSALEARPRLWFELLRLAAKRKPVAGPWQYDKDEANHTESWCRFSPEGRRLAMITFRNGWHWTIWNNDLLTTMLHDGGTVQGQQEAMGKADAWLEVEGYVVVNPCPLLRLGPWVKESSNPGLYRRRDAERGTAAEVREGSGQTWHGEVGDEGHIIEGPGATWFNSADNCMAACDRWLRNCGYILEDPR